MKRNTTFEERRAKFQTEKSKMKFVNDASYRQKLYDAYNRQYDAKIKSGWIMRERFTQDEFNRLYNKVRYGNQTENPIRTIVGSQKEQTKRELQSAKKGTAGKAMAMFGEGGFEGFEIDMGKGAKEYAGDMKELYHKLKDEFEKTRPNEEWEGSTWARWFYRDEGVFY